MQVNTEKSVVLLQNEDKKIDWHPGESLLSKLEAAGIVKEVFPLHGTICSLTCLLLSKCTH